MDTGPELEFSGQVVEWRGPAPYHFVPLPPDEAEIVVVTGDVPAMQIVLSRPLASVVRGSGTTRK